MVFSYNWLQSFFKKKLPKPEKLAEILNMHLADVEEVKKEGRDFYLNIDIRPNRAGDCFSHLGIAKEIAAVANFEMQIPSFKPKEDSDLKAKDFISVDVKNKSSCFRYTAKVICNVRVESSPSWLRERLEVCGLRPVNNIVDITNYVMLETGQPLHAFDGEKLVGKKIIVRFARDGEKITTLDEEKYDLYDNILVIADEKNPVGIAGIKGGKGSEISKSTKTVVLEAANFHPQVVRKGSKSIDLKTDASVRFEHGLDPNLTETAANRAASLMKDIAGGRIAQGFVDFYPKKVLPKKIKLDLLYPSKLLGANIRKKQITDILEKLSFKCSKENRGYIMVEAPTNRLDVNIPEDLIEEIGRVYGYEKIKAIFPTGALVPPKKNLALFWENFVKDVLISAGFTEVYNYHFASDWEKNILDKNTLPELENPISEDFKYMRPTLIVNLLKNVAKNQRNFRQIKIFELGRIFRQSKGRFEEKIMLTGLITGQVFYQAKGAVDLLLQKMGISNIWYDEYQPKLGGSEKLMWQEKRCAEIKIDDVKLGFLGEISTKILEATKVSDKAVVFDIEFEKLLKLASEEAEYRPISRFPAAVRDIAVLVPPATRVEEVLNKIEVSGGILIRDVDLFDIYQGEELPDGKKNLAFHIIYQAVDKTLTSAEIEKVQNKIIKNLEKNNTWQVRK